VRGPKFTGVHAIEAGGVLVVGRGPDVDLQIPDLPKDGPEVVLIAKDNGVMMVRVGRSSKILHRGLPILDKALMVDGDDLTVAGTVLELRANCEYLRNQENAEIRRAVHCDRNCKTAGVIPLLPLYDNAGWICDTCAQQLRNAWQPNDSEPSRLGGFDIVGRLGDGAMGKVYEAIQRGTGIHVALKTINIRPVGHRSSKEERTLGRSVRREKRILQMLNHPNIVRFYDSGVGGKDETQHYIAIEYVGGGDANQLGNTPAPTKTVYSIARDLFQALAYLHEFGYVHRDVKPHNLLLSVPPSQGVPRAKLTDMGLAKHSLVETALTAPGDIGGTIPFMSPEQLAQFSDLDSTADVYSAAVSVYWMFTGKTPQGYSHEPLNLREQAMLSLAITDGKHIPLAQQIGSRHPDLPESVMKKLDALTQPLLAKRLIARAADLANMFAALL